MKGLLRLPLLTKGTIRQLANVPIVGFVGFNGMGKSMAAVACAAYHLEAGRPVLSTARILDYRNPRPCELADDDCPSNTHGLDGHQAAHPLWRPLTDFRQMFDFDSGHILLDEVTGVADAREHQSMPVQVANYLPQLRRRNVTLGWTTIGWAFADIRLRRVTLAAVDCTGSMPTFDRDAIWPRNRLFVWRTYSAREFDEFQAHRSETYKAINRQVFWRPGSLVERMYDTTDDVLALGAATEAGMCLACGGKRSMPRCGCDERPAQRRQRRRAGQAVGPPERSDGVPAGLTDDDTVTPADLELLELADYMVTSASHAGTSIDSQPVLPDDSPEPS